MSRRHLVGSGTVEARTHPSRSPISPSASIAGEYSSAVLETIAGHKLVTSTLSNDVKQGIALTLSITASTALVQQVRKAAKFPRSGEPRRRE